MMFLLYEEQLLLNNRILVEQPSSSEYLTINNEIIDYFDAENVHCNSFCVFLGHVLISNTNHSSHE